MLSVGGRDLGKIDQDSMPQLNLHKPVRPLLLWPHAQVPVVDSNGHSPLRYASEKAAVLPQTRRMDRPPVGYGAEIPVEPDDCQYLFSQILHSYPCLGNEP